MLFQSLAVEAILDVATLLMPDQCNRTTFERPEAGDERAVIGAAPVAVQLNPVVEQPLDIVEGVRTIWITGEFDGTPRPILARLLRKLLDLLTQTLGFALHTCAAQKRKIGEPSEPRSEAALSFAGQRA